MLLAVALPAVLMGFSFPLANAITQRAERVVGRRAGVLYLANTLGAVGGSLAAGFILLPWLGIQAAASVLTTIAAFAVVPLFVAAGTSSPKTRRACAGSLARGRCSNRALAASARRLRRDARASAARSRRDDREAARRAQRGDQRDGVTRHRENTGDQWSPDVFDQAALAALHARARPYPTSLDGSSGVGSGDRIRCREHSPCCHPSSNRTPRGDRGPLERHSRVMPAYFSDANHDVLSDPRVFVYVNDGRHHLHMRPPASYDLITLEPPPIGYAGVAALYSREFYELARTRLKPRGYMSQWLPAYQVPTATTLAMIRAFVDVFPQAVLISGAEADLLLIGSQRSEQRDRPRTDGQCLGGRPSGRERSATAGPGNRPRDRRYVRRLRTDACAGDAAMHLR